MLHKETVDKAYDPVLHFFTELYITVSNGSFVTDRKRNTANILNIRHVSPFAQLAQKKLTKLCIFRRRIQSTIQ